MGPGACCGRTCTAGGNGADRAGPRAGGARKGKGKDGAEQPAGPPALQLGSQGAATCPAPSMDSDSAELPQTRHKAKPRYLICTDLCQALMFQDIILLSSTTRELARSLETDRETTPPLGSSLFFRQTLGAGKEQTEQVLKIPARLDSVQQVSGLKCHKSRSSSTQVGVGRLPGGTAETTDSFSMG